MSLACSCIKIVTKVVIKFIVDKSQANFWDSQHLKIGIADECGTFIEDVGTIAQGGSQYFVTATVPALLGPHRFVIYEDLYIIVLSFTNETTPGACDAIITFEIPSAPAESFEWSSDGENWQESSTFTDLCLVETTFYVRVAGETCTSGELTLDLTPGDCIYDEPYLADLADDDLYTAYNCYLNDVL